jgi:hypothetical protein
LWCSRFWRDLGAQHGDDASLEDTARPVDLAHLGDAREAALMNPADAATCGRSRDTSKAATTLDQHWRGIRRPFAMASRISR